MDQHTQRILEFDEVTEIIAKKSTNIYGREKVKERGPLADPIDIGNLQAETAEAIRILEAVESFTVGELEDIRPVLTMSKKSIPLQVSDIIKVYDTAQRIRLLKKYLSTKEEIALRLRERSINLPVFSAFESQVKSAVSPEGAILDNATSKLSQIRKAMNTLHSRIHSQLDQFIKSPQYQSMLQEPLITRREHRYVVPVKQEYRSQFPGLVLDSSASGATLFMEPLSVLKLTNELKFQQSEEKHEEEQIRLKLTQTIGGISDEMLEAIDFLGYYDALQASARFYEDFDCTMPRISDKSQILLKNARHPLLGKNAVPIDIEIGTSFKGLIITGPNTGGKTVSLKTTGLLAMLALSGFPIPAGDGSLVGIFTNIYADIGDEQSISQNLSTFSSHMTQIIRMIPKINEKTLILLDELGAGTDPSEGVALASALLNYFIKKQACIIATTHYNELKSFASHDAAFKNAAMEFNEENMQPSYKIRIGLPGRSCALKIAKRLGLNDEIIDDASEILGEKHFQIDTLLMEIDQEKKTAVLQSQEANIHKNLMEKLKKDYEEKLFQVNKEKEIILREAREESRNFIEQVLAELREARKEWRKSLKDAHKNKGARDEAKEKESLLKSSLDKTLARLSQVDIEQSSQQEETLITFKEGDIVQIKNMGKRGIVVQMTDVRNALVQVGSIKMEFPVMNLEPVNIEFAAHDKNSARIQMQKALTISSRVDIRGMRVEEALSVLAKHIDDAELANLESFQVIHGKGTGVLRKAVQEYLLSHQSVKSIRDGDRHEGGWGVTVVSL